MLKHIIVIILGLIIGSFLNVCIYRIPQGEKIGLSRSHCMNCGHLLSGTELIPVLSYLILRGRCKHCGEPISSRYLKIEILTAFCFEAVYYQNGDSFNTLLGCTFVSFGIVLSMIDWDCMLLPTRVIACGSLMIFCEYLADIYLGNSSRDLADALLAAGIGYLLFWMIYQLAWLIFKKEGLGFGDVRLMILIGLIVGTRGLYSVILLASILASLYGVVRLLVKKESEPFPLGPFISLGAFIIFII